MWVAGSEFRPRLQTPQPTSATLCSQEKAVLVSNSRLSFLLFLSNHLAKEEDNEMTLIRVTQAALRDRSITDM